MPLLDHFRSPVADRHRWPSFHTGWACVIADGLNERLPERFLAEAPAQTSLSLSADVAEFVTPNGEHSAGSHTGANGGLAVATYSPPQTRFSAPLTFPDVMRIEVFDLHRTRLLVAVVELVSPSNKDRPESREFFAAKCGSYLTAGVGVVVADIVTDKHFNLHEELVRLGRLDPSLCMPPGTDTYAVAYQPLHREGNNVFDIWPHPLAVGDTLPTVPLALRGYGCVPLDLEATYTEACRRSRIA